MDGWRETAGAWAYAIAATGTLAALCIFISILFLALMIIRSHLRDRRIERQIRAGTVCPFPGTHSERT